MAFEFSVSSNTLSLPPGESGSITITQTSSDPQAVKYGVNSEFAGGWDAPSYLDQVGDITYAFSPFVSVITGNGSLTLKFAAAEDTTPQTLMVTVYALQQMTGNPNSTIGSARTVTITVAS
jgi:hypothetical protein